LLQPHTCERIKEGGTLVPAAMLKYRSDWCRKLVDDKWIFECELEPPPIFDVSGLEAMTRLTELHITVPFVDDQQDLGKLTQLQRLTLDYVPVRPGYPRTTCLPFMCPAIASVTKLSFSIDQEVGNKSMLIAWHL